jgi:hypothetical protein
MLKHYLAEISHTFAKGVNKKLYSFPFYPETIKMLQQKLTYLISDKTLFLYTYQIETDSTRNYNDLRHQDYVYVKSLDLEEFRSKVEKFKGIPSSDVFNQLQVNQTLTITIKAYQVEF